MNIFSPMPRGSGAIVVHDSLAAGIPGYRVRPYDPRLALLPPLLRCVRVPETSLVHTTPEVGVLFARRHVPLVVTFHGYVLDRDLRGANSLLQNVYYRTQLRPLTRMALKRAAAVTAVSRYTAGLVQRDLGCEQAVRVIYNGIDTRRFRPNPRAAGASDGRLNVLFCGNLTRKKGAYLLPAILERTADNVDIWYTQGLRTRRSLVQHPRLHDLGRVEPAEMPALYRRADVLLAPTFREGFGLAVAEAMACGLPVVATDSSALPELIENGKGGFLCPYADVNGFAERINELAESPALRREMGEFNRSVAEARFDQKGMVAEYAALFEEVLRR